MPLQRPTPHSRKKSAALPSARPSTLLFLLTALLFTPSSPPVRAQEVKIEKVADGLGFPEGPLWHPDGFLLFSDIHGATIERLLSKGGTVPWLSSGKKTNGLILSNDRTTLYACCNSEKELLAIDLGSKSVRVLAADYDGRAFPDVNDAVVDAQGNVFFTAPRWGAAGAAVEGVYRYSKDGKLSLAAELDRRPNGIGISPDQKWLYVARWGGNDIWRFGLDRDGTLTSGTRWLDLGPGSGPDGMAINKKGVIYQAQTGDGQICVISSDGKVLQRIKVFERGATNCELAGENQKTLYVTGGGSGEQTRSGAVYRVTLP